MVDDSQAQKTQQWLTAQQAQMVKAGQQNESQYLGYLVNKYPSLAAINPSYLVQVSIAGGGVSVGGWEREERKLEEARDNLSAWNAKIQTGKYNQVLPQFSGAKTIPEAVAYIQKQKALTEQASVDIGGILGEAAAKNAIGYAVYGKAAPAQTTINVTEQVGVDAAGNPVMGQRSSSQNLSVAEYTAKFGAPAFETKEGFTYNITAPTAERTAIPSGLREEEKQGAKISTIAYNDLGFGMEANKETGFGAGKEAPPAAKAAEVTAKPTLQAQDVYSKLLRGDTEVLSTSTAQGALPLTAGRSATPELTDSQQLVKKLGAIGAVESTRVLESKEGTNVALTGYKFYYPGEEKAFESKTKQLAGIAPTFAPTFVGELRGVTESPLQISLGEKAVATARGLYTHPIISASENFKQALTTDMAYDDILHTPDISERAIRSVEKQQADVEYWQKQFSPFTEGIPNLFAGIPGGKSFASAALGYYTRGLTFTLPYVLSTPGVISDAVTDPEAFIASYGKIPVVAERMGKGLYHQATEHPLELAASFAGVEFAALSERALSSALSKATINAEMKHATLTYTEAPSSPVKFLEDKLMLEKQDLGFSYGNIQPGDMRIFYGIDEQGIGKYSFMPAPKDVVLKTSLKNVININPVSSSLGQPREFNIVFDLDPIAFTEGGNVAFLPSSSQFSDLSSQTMIGFKGTVGAGELAAGLPESKLAAKGTFDYISAPGGTGEVHSTITITAKQTTLFGEKGTGLGGTGFFGTKTVTKVLEAFSEIDKSTPTSFNYKTFEVNPVGSVNRGKYTAGEAKLMIDTKLTPEKTGVPVVSEVWTTNGGEYVERPLRLYQVKDATTRRMIDSSKFADYTLPTKDVMATLPKVDLGSTKVTSQKAIDEALSGITQIDYTTYNPADTAKELARINAPTFKTPELKFEDYSYRPADIKIKTVTPPISELAKTTIPVKVGSTAGSFEVINPYAEEVFSWKPPTVKPAPQLPPTQPAEFTFGDKTFIWDDKTGGLKTVLSPKEVKQLYIMPKISPTAKIVDLIKEPAEKATTKVGSAIAGFSETIQRELSTAPKWHYEEAMPSVAAVTAAKATQLLEKTASDQITRNVVMAAGLGLGAEALKFAVPKQQEKEVTLQEKVISPDMLQNYKVSEVAIQLPHEKAVITPIEIQEYRYTEKPIAQPQPITRHMPDVFKPAPIYEYLKPEKPVINPWIEPVVTPIITPIEEPVIPPYVPPIVEPIVIPIVEPIVTPIVEPIITPVIPEPIPPIQTFGKPTPPPPSEFIIPPFEPYIPGQSPGSYEYGKPSPRRKGKRKRSPSLTAVFFPEIFGHGKYPKEPTGAEIRPLLRGTIAPRIKMGAIDRDTFGSRAMKESNVPDKYNITQMEKRQPRARAKTTPKRKVVKFDIKKLEKSLSKMNKFKYKRSKWL